MWDVTATPEIWETLKIALEKRMYVKMRWHCVLEEVQQQQKRWNKKLRTKQSVSLYVLVNLIGGFFFLNFQPMKESEKEKEQS